MSLSKKIGFLFLAFYISLITGLFIYANSCEGMFCGLVAVLPAIPWVGILESLHIISENVFWDFTMFVPNGLISFVVGYGIGKLIERKRVFRQPII